MNKYIVAPLMQYWLTVINDKEIINYKAKENISFKEALKKKVNSILEYYTKSCLAGCNIEFADFTDDLHKLYEYGTCTVIADHNNDSLLDKDNGKFVIVPIPGRTDPDIADRTVIMELVKCDPKVDPNRKYVFEETDLAKQKYAKIIRNSDFYKTFEDYCMSFNAIFQDGKWGCYRNKYSLGIKGSVYEDNIVNFIVKDNVTDCLDNTGSNGDWCVSDLPKIDGYKFVYACYAKDIEWDKMAEVYGSNSYPLCMFNGIIRGIPSKENFYKGSFTLNDLNLKDGDILCSCFFGRD